MAHVALVTGGTRGIGEAISVELRDAGCKVAANYGGNDERAREFSERTGIATYRFDVGDFEAVKDGVARIAADLGPIDILVNNAGITRDGTMHRMEYESWDDVIRTNLSSCFNCCRAVIEGMRGRKFGRIVQYGSINGQGGSTARSTTPPPSRASTVSPRRWRRKARARASRSTPSRPAMSTPTWSARCRNGYWNASSSASRSAGWGPRTTSPGACCS